MSDAVNNIETNENSLMITGWAKFIGILAIIEGGLACLTFIGAAFGIPYIMAGLKLINAVDRCTESPKEAFNELNGYFKIMGITVLVILCVYIGILLLALPVLLILFVLNNYR